MATTSVTFRRVLLGPTPLEAAAARAARLVRVGAEKRRAIRRLIIRALAEGLSESELVRAIREIVGLSAPQRESVRNYREELEQMGHTPARVEKLVETYKTRKLRQRAVTIARTEISNVQNERRLVEARDWVARGLLRHPVKTWLVAGDEKLCPLCAPLQDRRVPLDKPFQTRVGPAMRPPIHPRCRCGIAITEPLPQRSRRAR
jgi:hypothetical protein